MSDHECKQETVLSTRLKRIEDKLDILIEMKDNLHGAYKFISIVALILGIVGAISRIK